MHEIITETKTVLTRAVITKCSSAYIYISLVFLLTTTALLIVVTIYCYLINFQAKQKPLLPCYSHGNLEKHDSNFILTFAASKVRYDRIMKAKVFPQKFVVSGSVSMTQQCIINNISKHKHYTDFQQSVQAFTFLLNYTTVQLLSNVIICSKIEVSTSLIENH